MSAEVNSMESPPMIGCGLWTSLIASLDLSNDSIATGLEY